MVVARSRSIGGSVVPTLIWGHLLLPPFSRRQSLAAGAPCAALALSGLARADGPPAPPPRPKEKPPRIDLDLVRDFVTVAHRDLDKVKKLYEQQPALLNAAWDWG